MNIGAGVWHADRNIGNWDAVVVNFPTIPCDHADPDQYRLPLNSDEISHRFDPPRGLKPS
jgi:dTDP-4-dehydrorhamnose 3,5-epimerase